MQYVVDLAFDEPFSGHASSFCQGEQLVKFVPQGLVMFERIKLEPVGQSMIKCKPHNNLIKVILTLMPTMARPLNRYGAPGKAIYMHAELS